MISGFCPGGAHENSPAIDCREQLPVSKGRLRPLILLTFSRPSGTWMSLCLPAMNRWAIFACPSGTI